MTPEREAELRRRHHDGGARGVREDGTVMDCETCELLDALDEARAVLKEKHLYKEYVRADSERWSAIKARQTAETQLVKVTEERDHLRDLQRLFDLQHKRMLEATKRWRAVSPEVRELSWPDLGELLTWLMEQADSAQSDRDAAMRRADDLSFKKRQLEGDVDRERTRAKMFGDSLNKTIDELRETRVALEAYRRVLWMAEKYAEMKNRDWEVYAQAMEDANNALAAVKEAP